MKKSVRIACTIGLFIAEIMVLLLCITLDELQSFIESSGWWIDLLSLITPIPILYAINYYLLAPGVYRIACFVWHNTGHYNFYKKRYSVIISNAIDWLVCLKTHWGVVDQAAVMQNANTCEGLLALRASGKHSEKSEIYKQAFRSIIDNAEEEGLPSKSLSMPTVVCTAMMLDLVAQEQKKSMNVIADYTVYEKMAKKLWSIRTESHGWGVYVAKTKDENCSLANTYWALRALSKYSVGKTEAFRDYMKSIYEHSRQGKFGFSFGDNPRLIVSSMYLSLYYHMDLETRKKISEAYDHKAAIDFVYKKLVLQNTQLEVETLSGMDIAGKGGPLKAPWNHVTIGYAIEALLLAYQNKDLNILKTDLLFIWINKTIDKNVKTADGGLCYYIPHNMEHNNKGIYTFPTAYLVQGLSQIYDCARK